MQIRLPNEIFVAFISSGFNFEEQPAQPVQPAQWNRCCPYSIGVKCLPREISVALISLGGANRNLEPILSKMKSLFHLSLLTFLIHLKCPCPILTTQNTQQPTNNPQLTKRSAFNGGGKKNISHRPTRKHTDKRCEPLCGEKQKESIHKPPTDADKR